jgi:hypothetical protein
MRNVFVLIILTLALAAAVQASEPAPGQLNVTAGGGINMPSGEDAKNGYVIGGGLGIHATSSLVLGAEVSYLGYSTEQGTADNLGNPIDYSISQNFFTYMGTARYFFSTGKKSPYVKGLAGRFTYSLDSVFGGLPLEASYSDLQYGGGLGMTFRGGSESNLYIEALYHRFQIEDDAGEVFTITMGMDLSFRP